MINHDILRHTESKVREIFKQDQGGHGFWHINNVRNIALKISLKEGGNSSLIELIALLHEVGDYKLFKNHETPEMILPDIIYPYHLKDEVMNTLCETIKQISFKGLNENKTIENPEGRIVQDADRLEAMGAIGIARTFAYGGRKNREIYNPSISLVNYISFDEYKKNRSTAINHFYEKLLRLKDLMNTKTARQLAEERHRFMEMYLEQFYKECEFAGNIKLPSFS